MRTITTDHTCINSDCQAEFDVTYYPGENGRRGHIDNWIPDTPAEVEPSSCPECGQEISPEDIALCHD